MSTAKKVSEGRRQRDADRAVRPRLRSPGRPPPARSVERAFWRLIAKGMSSEDAAIEVGVSATVGARWFRHGGGMPPTSLTEPTGRYLSFAEREEIAILTAQRQGVRQIARALGRDPGTVSRELRRNSATRAGQRCYRAGVAQWKAELAARRPKDAKLALNARLREYVEHRLAGMVTDAQGRPIPGPDVPWKSRRHGGAPTGAGARPGLRSRSATGCGSTSLTMSPCASVTRPSTSRCTSRVEVRCAVS